ncbi:hydroxyacylglutathione hydrolase [Utexia brackfieldae]|uniref:hydroxyacylglutathione hydrolase n=1 Tax=Utexia brackfieldae TaxID=3074108 RepID=UPI00370D2A16
MHLSAIPALNDNYIWILSDSNNKTVIIDPSEATPVILFLRENQYQPVAILLTHHHADHIGGVTDLLTAFPSIRIYGPKEVCQKLIGLPIQLITPDQIITELGLAFHIIATPGHTLGHVSYYSKPYLFCGDVLFSGGCGRIFEGTPKQMFNTLNHLADLDNKTLICCAHEYTLSNLKFAHQILPNDGPIMTRLAEVELLRKNQQMSLPTTLALEKKTNIFLRCHEQVLQRQFSVEDAQSLFMVLRALKDNF